MDSEGNPSLLDQLRPSLSSDRVATYLTAAGFDADRALRIYLWNAHVGEAFHLPIQAVEVALRNSINKGLSNVWGENWWRDPHFLRHAEREQVSDIETAKVRIKRRNKVLCNGQIVATLSFGFWVAMLRPRYNPPVWSSNLRVVFPNLPEDKTRYDLADSAKQSADLRNRIWHHEPIFRMDLSAEFHRVMELLGWICPTTAQWVRPHCRVHSLLRHKP